MLFNSYSFFIFFSIVLVVYYSMPSWKARKLLLLIASYLFYAAWNPPFVVLLWISTVADWFIARAIASGKRGIRKLCLMSSLLVNLGLLGYFKYGGFLLDNVLNMLDLMGWNVELASPDIILPVGISFYTFQTLSYTLDVYFGKTRPWHSFLDYALYVTFFPQLVAGPIVRAVDYLPQCTKPKKLLPQRLGWGASLMIIGMFEKIVIADGLLAPATEAVYDSTVAPGFVSAWCGTLAFAGQIFCDFAGYSTCAIGAALCLGFSLTTNFRFPYAAIGFSDFWKRWHISLSSWLRDYLYIPLGGNRASIGRTHLNLLATMLIGGLWHGASWTFVIWGGLHGLYLLGERLLKRVVFVKVRANSLNGLMLSCLTFLLICLAWVFFRAHTFGKAMEILGAMAGLHNGGTSLVRKMWIAEVLVVVGSMLALHWIARDMSLEDIALKTPWWVRSVAISFMLTCIVTLPGEDRAFIYFQF